MRTRSSPQGATSGVGVSGLIAATHAVRRKPIVSRGPSDRARAALPCRLSARQLRDWRAMKGVVSDRAASRLRDAYRSDAGLVLPFSVNEKPDTDWRATAPRPSDARCVRMTAMCWRAEHVPENPLALARSAS
jgi:hypothetical protein